MIIQSYIRVFFIYFGIVSMLAFQHFSFRPKKAHGHWHAVQDVDSEYAEEESNLTSSKE